MTKIALKIHDFMQSRRRFCLLSFIIVTSVLSCLLLRLDFKEDISDFLPLEGNHQEAMQVYQDVSGQVRLLPYFKRQIRLMQILTIWWKQSIILKISSLKKILLHMSGIDYANQLGEDFGIYRLRLF